MKIGVFMGGRSSEREVSLRTGEAIYQALLRKNLEAVKIDPAANLIEQLTKEKIDLAFLALHGPYGEDGKLQGFLEMLDIPYTGPGVLASALCIDKIYTKQILKEHGLPTPDFLTFNALEYQKDPASLMEQILNRFSLPVVVKAPTQGSTIGIFFVHQPEKLDEAIRQALTFGPTVLIEEFITGIELTAGVLGNAQPQALPLIEIVSETGVYDYEAKYTVGLSSHIIPPRISEAAQKQIQELAVKTFQALDCRGTSRVDFLLTAEEKPYILEVNTIPGMTETSLFPDAAKAAGISFDDLVEKIYLLALEK